MVPAIRLIQKQSDLLDFIAGWRRLKGGNVKALESIVVNAQSVRSIQLPFCQANNHIETYEYRKFEWKPVRTTKKHNIYFAIIFSYKLYLFLHDLYMTKKRARSNTWVFVQILKLKLIFITVAVLGFTP